GPDGLRPAVLQRLLGLLDVPAQNHVGLAAEIKDLDLSGLLDILLHVVSPFIVSRLVWVPGGLRPLWPAQRAGHSPRSPRQTGGASTAVPSSNTYPIARMARGQPGTTPTIKGAAAPPRAHAGGTRIHRKAILDPSAAACLGGDLGRPEDATVGGDGRILDVPPGV